MADEQLVQHGADPIQVGLLREVPRRRRRSLLGRQIRRDVAGAGAFDDSQRTHSKIGDPDLAVLVDEDVLGADIAVKHALGVARGKRVAQLNPDLEDLLGGKATDAAQQDRQVIALHQFHGAERLAVGLTHVEDAADGRMRDLPRQAHLGQNPLALLRGGEPDDLERHRRLQHEVFRLPHFA